MTSPDRRALVASMLLCSLLAIGCERRTPDDGNVTASNDSGAVASATDATTIARAGAAGDPAAGDPAENPGSNSSGASDVSPGGNSAAGPGTEAAPLAEGNAVNTGADGKGGNSGNASGSAVTAVPDRTGAVVEDKVIVAKLKSALQTDADIKGTTLSVDASHGHVILSGIVHDDAQKDRLEKIAREIDGVKSVQSNLVVKK